MTFYFFDSSGLAKRYLVEVGTRWVRGVVASHAANRVFVSTLAQVEVPAAVAKAQRLGRIDQPTAVAIVRRFNRHLFGQYTSVTPLPGVLADSQALVLQYPLKAYDAIQLATALSVQNKLKRANRTLVFVAADRQLLTAAQAEGLTVDDPNTHP